MIHRTDACEGCGHLLDLHGSAGCIQRLRGGKFCRCRLDETGRPVP